VTLDIWPHPQGMVSIWKYSKTRLRVITETQFEKYGIALLVLILVFVQRWVDLPAWVFWGSIAIWAVKDAILYP